MIDLKSASVGKRASRHFTISQERQAASSRIVRLVIARYKDSPGKAKQIRASAFHLAADRNRSVGKRAAGSDSVV